MHDFRCSDPNDMIDDKIAAKTRYFKETKEGVAYMCKVMEDMRNDVYVDSVRSLMKTLKLSLEQAIDAISVPDSDRERIIAKIEV